MSDLDQVEVNTSDSYAAIEILVKVLNLNGMHNVGRSEKDHAISLIMIFNLLAAHLISEFDLSADFLAVAMKKNLPEMQHILKITLSKEVKLGVTSTATNH